MAVFVEPDGRRLSLEAFRVIAPKMLALFIGLVAQTNYQHSRKAHVIGNLEHSAQDAMIGDSLFCQRVRVGWQMPADVDVTTGAMVKAVEVFAFDVVPVGSRDELWNIPVDRFDLFPAFVEQAVIYPDVVSRLIPFVAVKRIDTERRVVKPLRRGKFQVRPDTDDQARFALVFVVKRACLLFAIPSLGIRYVYDDRACFPSPTTGDSELQGACNKMARVRGQV